MKDKKVIFIIVSSIIGSLFGVGIVSGQEILQVFVQSPYPIVLNVIVYVSILMLMAFIILDYSVLAKPETFVDIIASKNSFIAKLASLFFILLSFIGLTLMFAGAGSLLNVVFGLNKIYGSIALSIFILMIGIKGSQSILKLFSGIVPILIVICILSAILGLFLPLRVYDSKMIISIVSKIDYIRPLMYSFYCSSLLVTVLVPIAKDVTNRKTIIRSILITALIFVIGIGVLSFVLQKFLLVMSYNDLPMLEITQSMSYVLSNIYLIALFGGIIVCPSAIIFGMINYFEAMENKFLKDRRIIVSILCTLALGCSTLGFSTIIALAVPVIGSLGFIVALLIVKNYTILVKKRQSDIV